MVDSQIETVKDIFTSGGEPPVKELTEAETRDNFTRIKKFIEKAGVQWNFGWDFLIGKLIDALGDKIPDIVGEAWSKYEELKEFTDKDKYPPEKPFPYDFDKHTITSEYNPYIEISLKNTPIKEKIEFNIALSLIISGINLEIQGGRIMKVQFGSCKGRGVIKCKGIEVVKKDTGTFKLLEPISLGKGIPIPKLSG